MRKPLVLMTAGGLVNVDKTADIYVKELDERIQPLVLKSTPAVLSVGMRCMKMGYAFHWPAGETPYFITPNGSRVDLKVRGLVPYLPVHPTKSKMGEEEKVATPSPAEPAGDGPVVKPPKRDLKKEAASKEHLLSHVPSNPYCEACQIAKMQHVPHGKRKGVELGERPKEFGDQITADHIVVSSEASVGIGFVAGNEGLTENQTCALVIKDRATGWIGCYPLPNKSAESARNSFVDFLGPNGKAKLVHTGNSGELIKAIADLGYAHQRALPHTPQMNGVAERAVRDVVEGGRTLLERAGLPSKLWPYAVKCYCFLRNVTRVIEGQTPWERRYGEQFTGPLLPFGSLVSYQPTGDHGKEKFHSKGMYGVFFGYFTKPGGNGDMTSSSCRSTPSGTATSRPLRGYMKSRCTGSIG